MGCDRRKSDVDFTFLSSLFLRIISHAVCFNTTYIKLLVLHPSPVDFSMLYSVEQGCVFGISGIWDTVLIELFRGPDGVAGLLVDAIPAVDDLRPMFRLLPLTVLRMFSCVR